MATVPFAFQGVVRLTSIGAAQILLTLVLGFAAINTGNNSLYLALSFLLASLLLSGVASKGGLRHIGVELFDVDEPWAGQPAGGLLRVTNRSRIWNVRDIVVVSPDLHAPVLVAHLRRGSVIEIPAKLLFERRGRVSFGLVDLYTRYPFGFFLKKLRRPLAGEAIVYPRLLSESDSRRGMAPDHGESRGANRAGTGSDIFTFREYERGDSLRHIHWRKSASLGRWIMKQPELEWVPAVRAVVDPEKPAWATTEQFEELISEAATFLHAALESGKSVTLLLPRMTVSGDGWVGRRSVFEALALVESVEPGKGPALLHEPGEIIFSLRTRHASQVA